MTECTELTAMLHRAEAHEEEAARLKSLLKTEQDKRANAEAMLESLRTDPACVWTNMLRGQIARPAALDHYEECKGKLEQAEAACAEMRHILSCDSIDCVESHDVDHALSSDCGKGWLSREEATRLMSERDRDRKLREDAITAYGKLLSSFEQQKAKIKLLTEALEEITNDMVPLRQQNACGVVPSQVAKIARQALTAVKEAQ